MNLVRGQFTKNWKNSWFSLQCTPFINITNKKLQSVFSSEEYHVVDYIDNLTNTCLVLKPQENLTNHFNEFNNLSSDQNSNSENIINCKYYDIDEVQTISKLNNKCTVILPSKNLYGKANWSSKPSLGLHLAYKNQFQ